MTDTLMDGGPLHPGSKSVMNPQLSLFTVPPTDLSMSSYRIVPIQTSTTGISPVEFQVDPQEDYVDLSRSFFEIELALKLANGDNVVEATRLWPTNNLAHTLFKQISVRLNGTLISPQTDNYHYKAFLETLLNYNRDDGETVLKPQGWYNALDLPTELTANNTNTEGEGHEAFQALSSNQQASVKLMKAEQSNYTDEKRHVLKFTPHIEVFPFEQIIGTRCANWNPDVLQFSQFVLEWCECSWKVDARKCQSKNVPVSSKAQPQRLPRADDENERQQKYSGLPDREK